MGFLLFVCFIIESSISKICQMYEYLRKGHCASFMLWKHDITTSLKSASCVYVHQGIQHNGIKLRL